MTALAEYERLEATGLWRASPEERPRDVIVSFGNATLVLSDNDETVLAHWSLAALTRINPRRRPAMYSPAAEAFETLEIEDDLMIRAIERVIAAVMRHGPHPGRLRLTGLVAALFLIAAVTVFWLPGALIVHTGSIVPEAARIQIGDRLLAHVENLSGAPCRSVRGTRALTMLRKRLARKTRRLLVIRDGMTGTLHLPGGTILLGRTLVEDSETPEALAAYLAVESLRSDSRDPLERLLQTAGPVTAFRLLISGRITDETLAEYTEHLLVLPSNPMGRERIAAGFADPGIAATLHADPHGALAESTISTAREDSHEDTPPDPVLSDSDWIALRNICIG